MKTACILCSRNCGLDVEVANGRFTKIRGDAANPLSEGYLCQKAARLDHYQNGADRLTDPLRKRADGTFEKASWDEAVADVAARLRAIRERHGGEAIAFYGGGGQGNHLGGVGFSALMRACRTRYHYSALAQEKTGDFWVNGRLFGNQTCHTTEDVEHADVVLFIGTNPWQAHGIRNARQVLQEIHRDPARTMIVIDPAVTETAKLADLHLQLEPGTDAQLLSALVATIVQEGLENREFLEKRTTGSAAVLAAFQSLDIDRLCRVADVEPARVREAARLVAKAKRAAVRVDLGIQQTLHSTLNSYLEKLVYLISGQFGKAGGNNLHAHLAPLIRHTDPAKAWKARASGIAEIAGLFPPNVLPQEIREGGLRALVVDSANPAHSGADAKAYRAALPELELLVVVDVALTETARHAHWVLPAASQYEKWEATFFNMEFPVNGFHLRRPVFEPKAGTLPEHEIYRRVLVAMGELPDRFPLLEAAARAHRRFPRLKLMQAALAVAFKFNPRLTRYGGVVLQQTLGRALPGGAVAAATLWFSAQRYFAAHEAAVRRAGHSDAEDLFERILTSRSGLHISRHTHDEMWRLVRTPDRRVHLEIPELLAELPKLAEPPAGTAELPFVLIAGERRAYNANTVCRDPAWRKADAEGALKMHPEDAAAQGLADGALAVCRSSRGEVDVVVRHAPEVRRGMVTLPHGYGLEYEGRAHGPSVNELTDARHRDPLTGTPYHKHVRVAVYAKR